MSTSEGTSHAPGSSSQQDASGSGGIVNNDTTNNHYDNSKGKTIDNSTHDTTYKDSNHIEYKTSIQNNIINTPPAPVDPSVIEILRNRVCAGAAFDSAERADPPRCHPDTRTAILQSGRSWIDALNVVFFFLWITGWAGMGKSAILQTLAEEYQRGMRLAASFFFFQASPDRNTTQGFVATIAYQLMESVPGAREIILQKISNNQTIFSDKSFDGLWRTLIVDTLCTAPPPTAPMLIVIDGVDEIASHDEQRALLHAILKSAEKLSSAHYKILIASRPEQPIEMEQN
ncbi:hypothetical protein BDN72DRAFT_855008 [Pluteus cervinus]|uniref:Uncharacterized protein n=1 Tax=Pluteus cervinus TaxID=181527 RepID=A0ACD3B532_9AGAR|nr:hypothetical protein BDN72DRAFT_855008 [Pluteus cervinus]